MLNIPAMEKIFKECMDLGLRKNHDYGPAGTSIDPIALTKLPGISTRLMDKISRLTNLIEKKSITKVKDESIRDTLIDTINYACYGVMLLDETWGEHADK